MVGTILYGDISSADYGAIITENESVSSAERDYSSVEIAGRNGDILIDNGRYKNIEITIGMFFPDRRCLEAYRSRMVAKTGYNRLEISYHPDEYRIARISGGIRPEMCGIRERRGKLAITFNCKPQRFLKAGEYAEEFEKSKTDAFYNPTGMEAKPLIRIYGTGVLGIGKETISIMEHGQEYMDIDCDLQECYYGTMNLNNRVTLSSGGFPALGPEGTGLSLGAGIGKVIVTPRWWRI